MDAGLAVQPAGASLPARPHRRNAFTRVVCMPLNWAEKLLCATFWGIVISIVMLLLIWVLPKYLGPYFFEWALKIRRSMTPVQVGVVCTLAIWFLTMCFVPSQPFAWIAAYVFESFGIPFLIIEIGTTLGFVSAFLLGRTLFRAPAQRLLNKFHGTKAILEAINRLGAFWVVFILRFGPVPYSFVSYVSSVPSNVPFLSYCAASLLALAPRNAATVFFGANFATLTDLFAGRQVNPVSSIFNIVALVVTMLVLVGGTIYCRRIMSEFVEHEDAAPADLEAPGNQEAPEGECAVQVKPDDSAASLDQATEKHGAVCHSVGDVDGGKDQLQAA
jgi:uncharacterized membrane protein YdjX (TVP38/TMEM64 family)